MSEKSKMISHEELSRIVEGVARQYSKDLVKGTGYDSQKYEDLVQDLWVKAYEILGEYVNAPAGFIAKCLYNKAVDLFRGDMKRNYTFESFDPMAFSSSQVSEGSSNPKYFEDSILDESTTSRLGVSQIKLQRLIPEVLEVAESYGDGIYKYVVAKLKLAGMVDEDFEPEIQVRGLSPEDMIKNYDISADKVVLAEVLGFKNANTGGSGSFKGKKYGLRLDLLSLLDVENLYKTYYEVTYFDGTTTQSKWIKSTTMEDAKELFLSSNPNCEILSIVLE